MEFEMIVPDVGGVELEPEYERDDDADRRSRSFSDIEEFFYDGDYNGRGDIRRLMEAIDEAYREWKMDQISDDWLREGRDFVRDYIDNNDLFDREEALDTAKDEIINANPDLPTDSEEFQQLINARINELEEEFIEEEFGSQGRIYDEAFQEFHNDKNDDYDEGDFLRDNYPYMSDIERDFDIQWPYYYDLNADQDGEVNVNAVANDFEDAIGRPVNASSSYHGATRQAGKYVVEPDGSLEGDEVGDAGLEFVSPPLPIDELLSDLAKVKEWANKRGCYTNESTGLHINISVPNYSLDKLDYVKLALLMGDEYVLELFGRSGNSYAKAATGKIRDALKRSPDVAPQLLNKMREHMQDLATKAIHSGTTDKYTSINTKSGYIEFRSPGGDWLGENFDKIESTLLRFTVALDAAIDPEKYRQDYLKKLYKLLESSRDKGDVDVLQLFANYSAGDLDKAALIRQVRQKQLARGLEKGKITGKMWWRVDKEGRGKDGASMEVVASSEDEAKLIAAKEWGINGQVGSMSRADAYPLRPYKDAEPKTQTQFEGPWGIYMVGPERFARQSGEWAPGEAPLYRFPSREAAHLWIDQRRAENPRMRTDIQVREIEPAAQQPEFVDTTTQSNRGDLMPRGPGPWEIYQLSNNQAVRPLEHTSRPAAESEARSALGLRGWDPTEYGVRTRQQQTQQQPQRQTFTGEWDVVMGGEVVFRVPGENQSIANQAARQWILGRSPEFLRAHEGEEVEVVPRYA